jgi:hypothetical protein
MMKLIIFLMLILFAGGSATSLLKSDNWSLGGHGDRGGASASHEGGGAAPAPEIGASVLGMLLAGGVAFYIRRHARA